MSLDAFEDLEFGGVDSRSNPLAMPQNRALRCLNWVPRQAGNLELRWGYSTVSQSTVTATAIHSLIPYSLWNGTRYLILGQSTNLHSLKISDGTVTAPTVRGAAIASSAKWQSYYFNNHLHMGNGTDQKWFDGSTWRDNGIRPVSANEVLGVVLSDGVREITSTEASAVTVGTSSTGGVFSNTTNSGYLIYVAFFDTSVDELGPSTLAVGSGRKTLSGGTSTQTIDLSVLPNLSGVNTNWVKLIARTGDGDNKASFCVGSARTITSASRSSSTVTVVCASHGFLTGQVISLSGQSEASYNGYFTVRSVIDANTFTITKSTGGNSTGGTALYIIQVTNAATTASVINQALEIDSYLNPSAVIANATRGIAASSVGGAQPGYQFYASIYNAAAGGHVGNRMSIGVRYKPTTTRCNVRITGLPDLSGSDSEWSLLIGHTGDGAEVPYAVMDQAGNWISVANGSTSITITEADIDGNSELPSRNGQVPSQCNLFAVVGDYIYAADTGSPTIRRSGSNATANTGDFVGDPAQSWAANDIQTFPTAEVVRGIFEVDYELFVGTQSDSAVLTDLSGVLMWRGPWPVGVAGARSMCKTTYGFFFVSGEKQLCTFQNGAPVPVSEEYETSLLSAIGDSYLSAVECVYIRDVAKGKDELRIECQDSNGSPFTVIHDFKLRDSRSPYGQGYKATFLGPLATAFTSVGYRDANGKASVYSGASTGNIYKHYSGSNDAGNEFSADQILLVSGGTQRPSVPYMDWYGDENITISVGTTLDSTLATAELLTSEAAQGYENDSMFRASMTRPEIRHCYVRIQLTSHSVDGDLTLNDPPHMPLETYGRLWELIPDIGKQRGR